MSITVWQTHRVCKMIATRKIMPRLFLTSSKKTLSCFENSKGKLMNRIKSHTIFQSSLHNVSGTCSLDIKRILKNHVTANQYVQNTFLSSGQIRDLSAEELQESQNPERQNVIKLKIFLNKANEILRFAFTTKWNSVNGRRWEDTEEDRQKLFTSLISRWLFDNDNFYYFQVSLESKPFTEWDLYQLIECVECLDADVNYDVFKKLQLIEWHIYGTMTEEKYHEYWKKISILLFELDVSPKEIDEFKPPNIIESTEIEPKAKDLIFLADKVLDEGRQNDSIEYCTKVLCSFDIPYAELSKLYFKRSKAYSQLGNIISAEKDTERAVYFSNLVQKAKD